MDTSFALEVWSDVCEILYLAAKGFVCHLLLVMADSRGPPSCFETNKKTKNEAKEERAK